LLGTLLGESVGEGEELARAPLERETGEINEAAAWLGERDEAVNSLRNLDAGMQHSRTGRRLGRFRGPSDDPPVSGPAVDEVSRSVVDLFKIELG
jgi:hypothetical protein